MAIEISFGWWVVPAMVTAVAFVAAYIAVKRLPEVSNPSSYSSIGNAAIALVALIYLAGATITALIVWLIYVMMV